MAFTPLFMQEVSWDQNKIAGVKRIPLTFENSWWNVTLSQAAD